MPRFARVVCPGLAHHIVQRGNYRQKVFDLPQDFERYVTLIAKYASKYEMEIVAYCLMTNHVHFIVVPKQKGDLAKVFGLVHMLYSHYKNIKDERSGHLWQARYYSSILDECYTCKAIRYVEQNPLRAGIVQDPFDYIWSSARQHAGLDPRPIIKTTGREVIRNYYGAENWAEFLGHIGKTDNGMIRNSTISGLPLGDETFIKDLEKIKGYCLKAKKMGRPRKVEAVPTF